MKITHHFPVEQFGFVEVETEADSIQEAIEDYNASKSLYNAPGEGLGHKEWCSVLDRYVNDGTGDTSTYLRMNEGQRAVIQELKKCFKRLKAKE